MICFRDQDLHTGFFFNSGVQIPKKKSDRDDSETMLSQAKWLATVFLGVYRFWLTLFSVKSVKFVWDKYLTVFRNRPFDQCGFNPHQNHSISGRKKHVPMWLVPVIVAYSWLHDFNSIDSLHHCHHIWNGGNGAPRQERCPSGHLARWVSWVPWRYFFGPQAGFPMGSMDLMGNA